MIACASSRAGLKLRLRHAASPSSSMTPYAARAGVGTRLMAARVAAAMAASQVGRAKRRGMLGVTGWGVITALVSLRKVATVLNLTVHHANA